MPLDDIHAVADRPLGLSSLLPRRRSGSTVGGGSSPNAPTAGGWEENGLVFPSRHPAFGRSLDALREMGVRVLFDPAAPSHARMPSWEQVMRELRGVAGRQNSPG
jgi:hypothetical protein